MEQKKKYNKKGVRLAPISEYDKEWFKDPAFVKEYNKLEAEYRVAKAVIELRLKLKKTQKEFAKKLKTTQSAISRLENGEISPTIRFLSKIATTFGRTLVIRFE